MLSDSVINEAKKVKSSEEKASEARLKEAEEFLGWIEGKGMAFAEIKRLVEEKVKDSEKDEPMDNLEAARKNLESLDIAPGLEELEMGAARVDVDDKAMINCRADLNQLVPFKYDWAWTNYLNACEHHWMPQEIKLDNDVEQWKGEELHSEDRNIVINTIGAFCSSNPLGDNNRGLNLYRLITNPECRQYILRQSVEETNKANAEKYIMERLGIDGRNSLESYLSLKSVGLRKAWEKNVFASLDDPNFSSGDKDSDIELLKSLVAYYLAGKGMLGLSNSLQLKELGKQGLMPGANVINQKATIDRELQIQTGVNIINSIKAENPHVWTDEVVESIVQMMIEATEIEAQYHEETTKGDRGDVFYQVCNYRLKAIGIEEVYKNLKNCVEV